MNSLVGFLVIFYLSSFTTCDTVAEDTQREGRSQRTGGLLNHNNNNGGGSVSSGYGAPSSGYGAGGISSGYGAPSGGGVSSGYGAPSGGSVSSGYGAPCDSYGCGGGGGSGAPVYVYQQGQGQQQNNGGGAGGLLGALLPLGALALLVPLGLAAFGALFPTTTIVGKRRRREAQFGNETELEQQAMLLHNYIDTLDLDNGPQLSLQKDMVAKYLECGNDKDLNSPSLHGCLQRLSCIVYDDTINIDEGEREVANIVLESILANEFVSKSLKKRLLAAGKRGSSSPGSCHLYKCHHHLLPHQPQPGMSGY